MLHPLRTAIEMRIRRLLGSESGDGGVAAEGGDAGFFGPGSACWKVHGDFTSMMIGGVTALLMQMLHPGALAGVWDHSNFRKDMAGRLKRTARFVAGTTYGATQAAEGLIARVLRVHDPVVGTTPDGAAYAAHDPALLTWVHVSEVSSFLAAYLRYRDPAFSGADQDRYYAETALIAEKLGARDVPKSRAAIAAYFAAVRPQLKVDERTRVVADALLNQPRTGAEAAFARLFFDAAKDLLPDWAAKMHGFGRTPPGVRLGVKGAGHVFRWALTNSAEARARRRAG